MTGSSECHLKNFNLNNAPVSILLYGAIHNSPCNNMKKYHSVLTPIVKAHPIKDDALLLRLAIAEKENSKRPYWQNVFAQRVVLRELRNDNLHAAELARYYLDVNIQPEKALHWARVNWQVAQQHGDRKLLDQATELWQKDNRKTQ